MDLGKSRVKQLVEGIKDLWDSCSVNYKDIATKRRAYIKELEGFGASDATILEEEANEKGITFEDSPSVEVELSPDQKTVAAKLREEPSNLEEYIKDWVDKLTETPQPTFEPTIQTDDTKVKISYEGNNRVIEVETLGNEITLDVSGTNSIGDSNSFSFYRAGVETPSPRYISLEESQATIKDIEENIIYKLTFI